MLSLLHSNDKKKHPIGSAETKPFHRAFSAFHLCCSLSQTSGGQKEEDQIPLDLDPELRS